MTAPASPPSPQVEAQAVDRIIREAARRFVLPRWRSLAPHEVKQKSSRPGDVVTAADTEAEAFLGPALQALLPGSRVVGEEAAAADPAVLDALGEDVPTWVIDPVDGTANFSKGRESFCLIVALVDRGETLQAWIHEPLVGTTAWARRGGGAWLVDAEGERTELSVDTDAAPERWRVVIRGMAGRGLLGGLWLRARARARTSALVDLHCAGIEHRQLAQGALHIGLYSRIKPWDHAAGALLHEEAGGFVARLDGSPYRPVGEVRGLLLAPSEDRWHEARGIILGA